MHEKKQERAVLLVASIISTDVLEELLFFSIVNACRSKNSAHESAKEV